MSVSIVSDSDAGTISVQDYGEITAAPKPAHVGLLAPPIQSDTYTPSNSAAYATGIYTNQATVLSFQNPSLDDGAFSYGGNVDGVPTGGATYAGSSGVSGSDSSFTSSDASTAGDVGFIQNGSSISVKTSDFEDGVSYTFSFKVAQRGTNQQNVQILLDGQSLGTIQPPSDGQYRTVTTQAVSPGSGVHTLTFVGLDSAGGDNTLFLGNVVRNTVAPTVADPAFATPGVGNGTFVYNPSGTPFTYVSAGLSGNNSGFTSGTPAVTTGNVAFVQQHGSISQSVSGFEADQPYRISLNAIQRAGNNEDLAVLVDGTQLGVFTPSGGSYGTYLTAAFTASAGTHTITIQGLDDASGDNTALLSSIMIIPQDAQISNEATSDPAIGAGQFAYGAPVSGWNLGPGSAVTGANSGFSNGTSEYEPDELALQGGGSVSQTVSGFQTDRSYTLNFTASQRAGNAQDFAVEIDGQTVAAVKPSASDSAQYSVGLPPLARGAHTISFVGLDTAGGDNSALLTNVYLTSSADDGFIASAPRTVQLADAAGNAVDSSTVASTYDLLGDYVGSYGVDQSLQHFAFWNARGQEADLAAAATGDDWQVGSGWDTFTPPHGGTGGGTHVNEDQYVGSFDNLVTAANIASLQAWAQSNSQQIAMASATPPIDTYEVNPDGTPANDPNLSPAAMSLVIDVPNTFTLTVPQPAPMDEHGNLLPTDSTGGGWDWRSGQFDIAPGSVLHDDGSITKGPNSPNLQTIGAVQSVVDPATAALFGNTYNAANAMFLGSLVVIGWYGFAAAGAGAAVTSAEFGSMAEYGLAPEEANAVNHIFGGSALARHNLTAFVQSFSRNTIAAYRAVQSAVQSYVTSQGLPDGTIFGLTESFGNGLADRAMLQVEVNGFEIDVQAVVKNGVAVVKDFWQP